MTLHLDRTSGPAKFARIGHVTIHNRLAAPIRVQDGGFFAAFDLLPKDVLNGGQGWGALWSSTNLAPGKSRDVPVSLWADDM